MYSIVVAHMIWLCNTLAKFKTPFKKVEKKYLEKTHRPSIRVRPIEISNIAVKPLISCAIARLTVTE
ncbi:hypothetical protein AGMMS50233_00180 [Endomicrobiia bacterium]|nr:hypothetical protein AGMMS50233_00180 [Endomicrobiia bacterium]